MDSLFLEFGRIPDEKKGFQYEIQNRIADSLDPNETTRYEPSHLDLHC